MPVWMTTPVEKQPCLTLRSWGVIQMPEGGRHFVGWCLENREGRVSSPIEEFDPKTLTGVTSTGRVYQLQGPPGLDGDGEYVRNRWLSIYGNPTWMDVTSEVSAPARRKSPTAASSQTAVRRGTDDVGGPVQRFAAQTGLPISVVKTFAAISDPKNARQFSKEAVLKDVGHVNVLPEPAPKKRPVLSRAWAAQGLKFEPVHLAETRQLEITVTKGEQVKSIFVPEKTTRRRVMELYLDSKK